MPKKIASVSVSVDLPHLILNERDDLTSISASTSTSAYTFMIEIRYSERDDTYTYTLQLSNAPTLHVQIQTSIIHYPSSTALMGNGKRGLRHRHRTFSSLVSFLSSCVFLPDTYTHTYLHPASCILSMVDIPVPDPTQHPAPSLNRGELYTMHYKSSPCRRSRGSALAGTGTSSMLRMQYAVRNTP